MELLAGATTAPSADTGEAPSHAAKARSLPEPATGPSPQREPAATPSEADVSKQGRDARGHSKPEPAATPSEVDVSKQGRKSRGHGKREPATASSMASVPGPLTPQSKAPARDQPPARNAKPAKENHAAPGEDGGGG